MSRSALWSMTSVVAAAWLAGPPAVTRAADSPQEEARDKVLEKEVQGLEMELDQDVREPLVRAFHMAGSNSHLGVSLGDIGGEERGRLKLSEERGALVKEVQPDTPAAKAGLKADDVITRFDGEAVRSAAHLARLVRETPPGRTVAIEVVRGGAPQRLSATLAEGRRFNLGDFGDVHVEMPPVPPLPPIPPIEPLVRKQLDRVHRGFWIERPGRLGITYQELSGQLARYFKVEDGALLVSEVSEDSPAAKAGLKAGDVIVRVNGKAVAHGRDLRDEVANAEAGAAVVLGLQRDGKPMEIKVTVGPRSRAEREPSI